MGKLTESALTIAIAVIGLATLAVIVSKKAQTPAVIKSLADGFSTMLKTAVSPIS